MIMSMLRVNGSALVREDQPPDLVARETVRALGALELHGERIAFVLRVTGIPTSK
jgi:hypothetical protein